MKYGIKNGVDLIAVFHLKEDREAFLEYLKETYDTKKGLFQRFYVKQGLKLTRKDTK